MYRHRRRSVDDEVQLTEAEGDSSIRQSVIKEESHVIPPKLSVLKRRVITKVVSPRGKLLYWWITVFFLGLFAFLFVIVPLLVERNLDKQDCTDYEGQQDFLPYFYRTGRGQLEICRQKTMVLEGSLGVGRSYFSEVKVNVFNYSMDSTLNITSSQSSAKNCLLVQWVGLSSKDVPLKDCYEVGDSHWFGAYEHRRQSWPINMSEFASDPLVSPFLPQNYLADRHAYNDTFGPILHPLWLNSNGVGILVEEGVQLHVGMNGSQLCLIAQPFDLDCFADNLARSFLNYTICVFDTTAQTAQFFLNATDGLIPRPSSAPSPQLFLNPVWSTRARFESDISTYSVANFCSSILDNMFNRSQLVIDSGYSQFYGELDFNANVNVSNLLNSSCEGFNITAWVHPFVNFEASNFQSGLDNNLYVPGGNDVSLVKWWQGFGAVINFADKAVARNQSIALTEFKETHQLSSFKFDAGEYTYLPKCVKIQGTVHPGDFTKSYVKFVANSSYSDLADVRVGFYTQEYPILVRLLDRTPSWSAENGLQSILASILAIGLGGYSFVVPDMIGGNGRYIEFAEKPSKELYIRWAQLNVFLPVMELSISLWDYDNEVTRHVHRLAELHYSLGFQRYAEDALRTGFPIIRPLWWNCMDNKTWTVSDQFFIGDDYMIAPVLNRGETERRVYFPRCFNYFVAFSNLSAESACPQDLCLGGSSYTFNVSLYQVLYFHISS